MGDIRCLKCRKRTASVKLVRIVDGKARSIYLCQECAAEVSPFHKQTFSLQEAIEKVLTQLIEKQSAEQETDEAASGPRCPSCGTTLTAYRKSFLLGCAQCYQVFGGALDPQLRRLHGSTRHVGRVPRMVGKPLDDVAVTVTALKKELASAVSSEDFEKAARLRDRIRHLQGGSDHVIPEMPEM